MNNVIDFPTNIKYKVLFNLPQGKVIQISKSPEDDFDVTTVSYTHLTLPTNREV